MRRGKFSARTRELHSNTQKRSLARVSAAATCEPMEARRMLSAINWINKGTAINDTDGFNVTYGANSTLARSIVQRAIDDWERVVTNFNGAAGRNTFDLTVNGTTFAGATALGTGVSSFDALGKPQSATFTLDNDGGGSGWYFDTTPGTAAVPEDSDFSTFISPFAADRTSGTGYDFYRFAARGVGFALGMNASAATLSALSTDVADDPNSTNPADRLLAVDIGLNGSTDYTLTTDGGRNLFEGGGTYSGPAHPNDLLNNGRTLPTSDVRRVLISDTSAAFLRDVYNYTITLPSLVNTFYVNLNMGANSVTINGDMNVNNDDTDVIDLEVTGTAMSFEVNGTDETIDGAEFGAIIVNSGFAIDDIDVDEVLSGKSVSINGGDADDDIKIAPQFGDIDTDLDSDVTINGGGGFDTLFFNDSADGVGSDTYTITVGAVQKGGRIINHSFMEHVEFTLGSPNPNTWNIDSTFSTYDVDIFAGNNLDTFNVGNHDYDSTIFGDIHIDGYIGNDVLNINDGSDAGTGDYSITATTFEKTGGGTLTYDSIGSVVINGSEQASTYTVDIDLARSPVTINAGAGNDVLDIDGANNDIDHLQRTERQRSARLE